MSEDNQLKICCSKKQNIEELTNLMEQEKTTYLILLVDINSNLKLGSLNNIWVSFNSNVYQRIQVVKLGDLYKLLIGFYALSDN